MFQHIVRTALASVLAVAFAVSSAEALTAGPEFQVNTLVAGHQRGSSVAALRSGGFVVVYQGQEEGEDGPALGIYGQRYSAAGKRAGEEFRVNTKMTTTRRHYHPSVAALPAGGFVIVWHRQNEDHTKDVYAQRYDAAGSRVGPEFRVNTTKARHQMNPHVAALSEGDFVVVWTSTIQGYLDSDIFGQRFAADGTRAGGEFRVNSASDVEQRTFPRDNAFVAALGNGGFVVVWQSARVGYVGADILGQRFTATGTRVGGAFRANTYRGFEQGGASVAALGESEFVIIWASGSPDRSAHHIYGQRYNATGRVGGEFRVNRTGLGSQNTPSVTALSDGRFFVAYTNILDVSQAKTDVHGQLFNAQWKRQGPEFRVNAFKSNSQTGPAAAALKNGGFVVVWDSMGQDGSGTGVFGRRYSE